VIAGEEGLGWLVQQRYTAGSVTRGEDELHVRAQLLPRAIAFQLPLSLAAGVSNSTRVGNSTPDIMGNVRTSQEHIKLRFLGDREPSYPRPSYPQTDRHALSNRAQLVQLRLSIKNRIKTVQ